MEKIVEKFTGLLEELNSNPQLIVTRSEISPPLKQIYINDIAEDFSIDIRENIKKFYQQVGEVRISWELSDISPLKEKEDNSLIMGNMRLLKMNQVFEGFDGNLWKNDIWTDEMDEETKKMKMQLRPFDYFYGDDSACVCFIVNENTLDDTMHLHSVDFGVSRLNLSFEEYLDLLLITKGYFKWQFLVSPSKNLYDYSVLLEEFYDNMSKIFPAENLSGLSKYIK